MDRLSFWMLGTTIISFLCVGISFSPQASAPCSTSLQSSFRWHGGDACKGGGGMMHIRAGGGAAGLPALTVRQAKATEFKEIAELRCLTYPVVTTGSAGFLGGKVVIKDPVEANRRALMTKVSDLMNGEAVAVVALEGQKLVGVVDCTLEVKGKGGQAGVWISDMKSGKLKGEGKGPQNPVRRLFLRNMFVLPEWRRCGVAKKLLGEAEFFARKSKARELFLEVDRDNIAAAALYTSSGFEEYHAEEQGFSFSKTLLRTLSMGTKSMTKRLFE